MLSSKVLNVELSDPSEHFEELIKFFFLFHDPTTADRQGNDVGTQYASAIFVKDEEQKSIVEKVTNDLQKYLDGNKKTPYIGKTVSTNIHDYTTFVSTRTSDPLKKFSNFIYFLIYLCLI